MKTVKDLEISLFLMGEEFKDLKIRFDTLVEKNDSLVMKNVIIVPNLYLNSKWVYKKILYTKV